MADEVALRDSGEHVRTRKFEFIFTTRVLSVLTVHASSDERCIGQVSHTQ